MDGLIKIMMRLVLGIFAPQITSALLLALAAWLLGRPAGLPDGRALLGLLRMAELLGLSLGLCVRTGI